MSGISKACCSYVYTSSLTTSATANTHCRIPPVVSKGYQAKGGYQTINGLKTCE